MENIFVNARISCDNLSQDGGSLCYILCFSISYFDGINNRRRMRIILMIDLLGNKYGHFNQWIAENDIESFRNNKPQTDEGK